MPNWATHVQQDMVIIEIRPYRNEWQCFEAPGVQPDWTGESAKEDAIGYATARAKFGRDEIRVLNADGRSIMRLNLETEANRPGHSYPLFTVVRSIRSIISTATGVLSSGAVIS
jgi:hypothetical protein